MIVAPKLTPALSVMGVVVVGVRYKEADKFSANNISSGLGRNGFCAG